MKYANAILIFIIGLVGTIWLTLVSFIYASFGKIGIDQLLFTINDKNSGANTDIVGEYFKFLMIWLFVFIVAYAFGLVIVRAIRRNHESKLRSFVYFNLLDNPKKPQAGNRAVVTLFIVVLVVCIFLTNIRFDVYGYIKNNNTQSDLYERHYVDPSTTEIVFPQQKQNLIYIVLESMSVNLNAVEVDGNIQNLIPNLEHIGNENTHFSPEESLRGPYMMEGLSWTSASLVGQSAGVPLKENMSTDTAVVEDQDSLLPGVSTIGEILEKEGYKNTFMLGSEGEFGARKQFFEGHGNYDVIDTNRMKKDGLIPKDYHVFWGVEDTKLLDLAKDWLSDDKNRQTPFNLTLLTVDTHFMDGYTDGSCPTSYSVAYANAYACSDSKVSSFIKWIQKQDFYANTTIVVVGDHDSMNQSFVNQYQSQDLTLFHTIINPVKDLKTQKYREYNVMDLFPTTLSSLGVEIKGDKLGLGTDLFSETQTLTESLGYRKLNEELKSNSEYYNTHFLLQKADEANEASN